MKTRKSEKNTASPAPSQLSPQMVAWASADPERISTACRAAEAILADRAGCRAVYVLPIALNGIARRLAVQMPREAVYLVGQAPGDVTVIDPHFCGPISSIAFDLRACAAFFSLVLREHAMPAEFCLAIAFPGRE